MKKFEVRVMGTTTIREGKSDGKVRMQVAKTLKELGYFKTIGKALKEIRVKAVQS